MTISAAREPTPTLQLDLDHTEQFTRSISAITINPFLNAVFYFFPFLSAITSQSVEIRDNDPAQEAMMPQQAKSLILREIRELTHLSGIWRTITPCTKLNQSFWNCGGLFSLTKPILFMPHQHLFRPGKSPFMQETQEDALDGDIWRYTDNETRFLIARELGHIRENSHLLRIAVKIALLSALFIFAALPIGWPLGLALLAGSFAIHLISERCFQARMDLIAVDITAARMEGDRRRATEVAILALEKMRKQNLARRETSKLCRFYITKLGNNRLDFSHPFLTSRIATLQKSLS